MITDNYKELNRKLHEADPHYGTSGHKYAEPVRELSMYGRLGILDYGAGKCTLSKVLGPAYRVTNYDPCVPGLDTRPEPHDVVVCTDVMEHIEPEFVDSVLSDIRALTKQAAFFSIAIRPARKTLEDGRNAHVSLKTIPEWKELITKAGFTIVKAFDDNGEHGTFGLVCE